MYYKQYKDEMKLSRLGLGAMRLPAPEGQAPGASSGIVFPEAFKIIDRAYELGINYFDTAYVYSGGESERCLGECMKKYPRDSFYLATKYHIAAEPDYKRAFEEELKRLQTDYVDFYLIHCVMDNNIQAYLDSGAIEYFLEQQRLGKIRNLGFSSHSSPENLARMADHHKWDFVQIQLNCYDWYFGTAKQEYEVLEQRNIPIMVMEPVRGGRLAALTPDAVQLLKNVHPDWSVPSWALRFVKSLPQVQVVLSGMSMVEQVEENCRTFADNEPLTAAEQNALREAVEVYRKSVVVPCTACAYCTPDCPAQINIPEVLRAYNNVKIDGEYALKQLKKINSAGSPTDCIGCGSCTGHCPQNIDTPAIMAELQEMLKK